MMKKDAALFATCALWMAACGAHVETESKGQRTETSGAVCWSDSDCTDDERCNTTDHCELPPGCHEGEPCPAVCWGRCEDDSMPPRGIQCHDDTDCDQGDVCLWSCEVCPADEECSCESECVPAMPDDCALVDCPPGTTCEVLCPPCPAPMPGEEPPACECEATCVPEPPDDCALVDCPPGTTCELLCPPCPAPMPGEEPPACECEATCVPDNECDVPPPPPVDPVPPPAPLP